MALGTTNLREQLFATLDVGIIQATGSRHSQTTVPNHELVVLLVAHLVSTIIGSTLIKIGIKGFLLGDACAAQYLIDALADSLISTVGIIGMQDAGLRLSVLLDVADDLSILTLSLGPGGSGVEPVAVGTRYISDVPDGIGTSTVL